MFTIPSSVREKPIPPTAVVDKNHDCYGQTPKRVQTFHPLSLGRGRGGSWNGYVSFPRRVSFRIVGWNDFLLGAVLGLPVPDESNEITPSL